MFNHIKHTRSIFENKTSYNTSNYNALCSTAAWELVY